jgi:SAM-dependent methyltransferase
VLLALRNDAQDGPPTEILRADACALPFGDRSFDAVIFAFNGLDMIAPEPARLTALSECERVLRPGGYLIFSSHNPLGALFSPWGFVGLGRIRHRARYLLGRQYRLGYLAHPNGRRCYQARPETVIAQAERVGLSFALLMSNRLGIRRPRALVRLSSEWPYYVFVKLR